jgi:hypothetical protein
MYTKHTLSANDVTFTKQYPIMHSNQTDVHRLPPAPLEILPLLRAPLQQGKVGSIEIICITSSTACIIGAAMVSFV